MIPSSGSYSQGISAAMRLLEKFATKCARRDSKRASSSSVLTSRDLTRSHGWRVSASSCSIAQSKNEILLFLGGLKKTGEGTNHYLEVLNVVAKRMKYYDDDRALPCYGFGDPTTGKDAVFSLFTSSEQERGLDALVEKYKSMSPARGASGPASFAPLIRQAMKDVYNSGMKFHVLLILSEGQISSECLEDTKQAIVEACAFPLSIVVIGIGEGPWTEMNFFDKELPEREWDNFRFFDYSQISKQAPFVQEHQLEDEFEFNVIAELPEQYVHARNLTGESNQEKVARLVDRIPSDLVIDAPRRHS